MAMTFAMVSALASLEPDFPLAPVYFVMIAMKEHGGLFGRLRSP